MKCRSPLDAPEDDFDLAEQTPQAMTHRELADAIEALAARSPPDVAALLAEAARRLRACGEIRAALLWRTEQVEQLEAQLAELWERVEW